MDIDLFAAHVLSFNWNELRWREEGSRESLLEWSRDVPDRFFTKGIRFNFTMCADRWTAGWRFSHSFFSYHFGHASVGRNFSWLDQDVLRFFICDMYSIDPLKIQNEGFYSLLYLWIHTKNWKSRMEKQTTINEEICDRANRLLPPPQTNLQ